MSRSDTETYTIDATRPKYTTGREVSFAHGRQVLAGRITRSTQVIRGSRLLAVTYDIDASGRTFTGVPEEDILPQKK